MGDQKRRVDLPVFDEFHQRVHCSIGRPPGYYGRTTKWKILIFAQRS
jgi:hypothetical protein